MARGEIAMMLYIAIEERERERERAIGSPSPPPDVPGNVPSTVCRKKREILGEKEPKRFLYKKEETKAGDMEY